MDQTLQQALSDYQPSQAAIDLVKQTDILFLVGPSGAGKDSLKDGLMKTGDYYHLISHTSRRPRINHGIKEEDGREYHFMDLETAQQMLKEQAFVEAKIYSGNLYGTSVDEVGIAHDSHKVALTDLEVQGVAEYKAIAPESMAVFLLPPDFTTWQERLQRRYGDVVDVADMQSRLETALEEIDQLLNTDHYYAVVNDKLEDAINEVRTITETHQHDVKLEERAREVAKKLCHDIRAYLAE